MKKAALLLLFAALVVGFFALDLGRFLTLDALKSSQAVLAAWFDTSPWLVAGAYLLIYVAVTALSLPGAVVMTLAGGAFFGLWTGLLLVSFASSIGATLAFLASRFLLRDWVQSRFGNRLAAINAGMAKDGAFYLFTLRLVPVFPFFIINLLMGLTPIRTRTFYWVSQLGMLAGSAVYVNAGTQLAQLESLSGILSPGLIGSFALLGLFPLLAKQVIGLIQARQVYAGWQKPAHFERNLVVIGAGAGGLVTAYIAAAVKARVTLIEGHKMGGDCLNYGCVPSKALIRSARFMNTVREADALGIANARADADFGRIMARVQNVVRKVEPHDSVERYSKLGVEVIQGHARITSPWTVEVTTEQGLRTLSTRAIVIATGAAPVIPNIPGIDSVRHVTSDSIWSLTEKPERLLVLGGGPIGCELAQAFARIGCQVTLLARSGIMGKEDADAVALVEAGLASDGVQLLKGLDTVRCERVDGEQRLIVAQAGTEQRVEQALTFDVLLCATGRKARVSGFGLEELGIPLTKTGTIEVNDTLQTRYPQHLRLRRRRRDRSSSPHTAAHQAWYAAVNALFAGIKSFKADYRVIPWGHLHQPGSGARRAVRKRGEGARHRP
jgi:pyruvate/2-oxoglutarate dehydrogenase complex dihydrolipoamide dehydrogenase (E3) component/uncharacterized membrane protein YdjX (TVP38/TMEM64 family)